MKKRTRSRKSRKEEQVVAILGLLLNILVLPGLGTIIAGERQRGILQIVLFIAGIFLTFTIFGAIAGIGLIGAMWIWALIMGIQFVKKAYK